MNDIPRKLNIKTLHQVWTAFIETATQARLKTKPTFAHSSDRVVRKKKSRVTFEFESREWDGSVVHECSTAPATDTRAVKFITIQLPNDSFIVTDTEPYNASILGDGGHDDDDWNNLVRAVADKLMSFAVPSFGSAQFDLSKDLEFDARTQTLMFRLWSESGDRCFVVEWFNGPSTYSTKEKDDARQKRYDELLKNWIK